MTDTDTDITRRRALAIGGVTAGAAVGLGLSSCSDICVLNGSVTEGPYYLDGALYRQPRRQRPLGERGHQYKLALYSQHTGYRTKLDDDMVYPGGGAKDGLTTVTGDTDKGFTAALTVGIDPDAENTGAGSGGGGSEPPSGPPPSGMPSGTPAT